MEKVFLISIFTIGLAISTGWGTLEEVGSIKGNYKDVVVIENYAYSLSDSGLKIINVSNPASPVVEGSLFLSIPGIGGWKMIQVSQNYAYIANPSQECLIIVNVSNPSMPTLVSNFGMDNNIVAVHVDSIYAYVVGDVTPSDSPGSLKIVDISNPYAPVVVGSFFHYPLATIYVDKKVAYVNHIAWGPTSLYSIDVSDPRNPTFMDSLGGFIDPRRVYVDKNYAYVATSTEGLKIVDVSDPFNLTFVGSLNTTYARDVYVENTYAYVADGGGGLKIIDVSDPYNPVFVDSAPTLSDNSLGVYGKDGYIYLADGTGGLRIFKFIPGIEEISDTSIQLPILYQNYPNPFITKTTIKYVVPIELREFTFMLEIYDVTGRLVNMIKINKYGAGCISWDGKNHRGEKVPNGVYFYQLSQRGNDSFKNFGDIRRMTLIR